MGNKVPFYAIVVDSFAPSGRLKIRGLPGGAGIRIGEALDQRFPARHGRRYAKVSEIREVIAACLVGVDHRVDSAQGEEQFEFDQFDVEV